MPLFRSKFQPKKCPPRKTSIVSNLRRNLDALQLEKEFSVHVEKVKLELGDNLLFEFDPENGKGKWVSTPNTKIKSNTAAIQRLEGENNWLKIQAELLLNMLTETALEAHLKTAHLQQEDNSESKSTKRNSFKGRKLF